MLDMPLILKEAKKIAIVGLSPDVSKDSHQVGKYLLNAHYQVVPIYPKGDSILGQKVYHDMTEALRTERPDIVVVFRKSEACVQIAQEILASGFLPKVFWMQLGISNAQAKDMLESQGISVVANQCIKIEHQRLLGGQ
ncbi:CoA-binding protein [Helicobacter sp. 11S02596-1]|uniref:CoA-binding protein n=1 Tax=Helicobacter sp. 11S02596-1 TaxID=1476194 RepID=UPI000BA7C9E7|nr:CoA-binding protein [Helicobacter sp. 11S02596-1]PAF44816.1 hypothetical protein BJI48_02175 [Helicobacter sp. 11S02596-1]